MRGAFLAGLAAVAAVSALPLGAGPAQAAAAQKDWTRVVSVTPDGGFRVGNPEAPVKLVEYGSLTCNHCAHFAAEGMPALLGTYVKSGRVSFEFRNFIRDPADLTAALLARCAGPSDYFALTDRYFATQSEWLGRLQKMSEAEAREIDSLPVGERLARLASFAGLDAAAAKAGVTPARARQCLADDSAIQKLVGMRGVAVESHAVQGTPTFLINGKKAEGAHDWGALEPLLGLPGG